MKGMTKVTMRLKLSTVIRTFIRRSCISTSEIAMPRFDRYQFLIRYLILLTITNFPIQVDAHATLDQGVVVQVSGELSNNGQPMRGFIQTFVLAAQLFKNYYVHNHIFRYQDKVFNNEVVDNVERRDICKDIGMASMEDVRMVETMPVVIQDIVKVCYSKNL